MGAHQWILRTDGKLEEADPRSGFFEREQYAARNLLAVSWRSAGLSMWYWSNTARVL